MALSCGSSKQGNVLRACVGWNWVMPKYLPKDKGHVVTQFDLLVSGRINQYILPHFVELVMGSM